MEVKVNDLIALSTYFRKKNFVTWSHPRSKMPHQIDHIICQKSEFFRFTDAGSISPMIDSDHRAVKCKIKFLPPRKKKVCSPRLRISRLDNGALNNKNIQNDFCERIRTTFYSLSENTTDYDKLETAMTQAAYSTLPKKVRNQPSLV